MLIEFAVENFKSLKDLTQFSMLSTRRAELPNHKLLLPGTKPPKYVNKVAVFFGSNASGKSNILSAFGRMCSMVKTLGISREDENNFNESFYTPYALCKESQKQLTMFQAIYMVNNVYFRYGFTYDLNQICGEWLYSGKIEHEICIFMRNSDLKVEFCDVEKNKRTQFTKLKEHLTKTNLFLSVGADLKNRTLSNAAIFFNNIIKLPSKNIPLVLLHNSMDRFMPILGDLLSFADTGITNIEKKKEKIEWKEPPTAFPDGLKELVSVIKKLHEKSEESGHEMLVFNHSSLSDGNDCPLHEKDESSGTIAYLRLAFLICRILYNNSIAIVDELDENLHPLLIARILQFFTSIDRSTAQLICTSHTPIIFSPKVLRRDELWMTEKEMEGRTFINCAADYKDTRKNQNLTQRYLEGLYGGVPLFNNEYMASAIEKVNMLLSSK